MKLRKRKLFEVGDVVIITRAIIPADKEFVGDFRVVEQVGINNSHIYLRGIGFHFRPSQLKNISRKKGEK